MRVAAAAAQVACSILIVANFRTRFISCPGTDSSLPSSSSYSTLTPSVRLCLCLSLSPSLFIDFGRSNNVVAQRVHSSRPHTHTHTLRHAQRTVTLFLIHSSGRHTASIARTNKSSGLLRTALLCLCLSALFLARPQFITPQSLSACRRAVTFHAIFSEPGKEPQQSEA